MIRLQNGSSSECFYATTDSAGFDITAQEDLTLEPGAWKAVPTGLRIVEHSALELRDTSGQPVHLIPELQIRPRSGLALRHGISLVNTPSTIDADYRGEILVILINHGTEPFPIRMGDRVAQGVAAYIFRPSGVPVKADTRGTGGFGSTGRN